MSDFKFMPYAPGTKVRIIGSPLFGGRKNVHYIDVNAPALCTAPRATGDAKPPCILCWLASDLRLAATELDRLVNEGGPARD